MASASTFAWQKAAPPALTLMPDNSVPPGMSLVSLKLLPQCRSSEGLGPIMSAHGPFKMKCPGLQKPFISLSHNLHCFLQPEFMGTSLPGTGILGWGSWCGAEILCSSGEYIHSQDILSYYYLPHMNVGPALFHVSVPPTSFNVASLYP